MNYAFDACAMIAYLRGETGSAAVDNLLTSPSNQCYVHTINLLEVYYDFIRHDNEPTAREALRDLAAAGVIERHSMNRSFILRVGQLKSRGRISLADCFCIVLAQDVSAHVITSDHREFDPLASLGIVPITFIR